jgi:hypothetical protein
MPMSNEFSWSAAREARIDRAIDRAVRDMMQVDPPLGLRRRVLSQIAEPKRRQSYLLPGFALVALVVVGIISMTVLHEHADAPTPPKAPSIVATGIPVIAPPASGTIEAAPTSPQVAGRRRISRERIPMPRVSNVFGSGRAEVAATSTDATRSNRGGLVRPIPEQSLPPLTIVPLSERPLVLPSRIHAARPQGRE